MKYNRRRFVTDKGRLLTRRGENKRNKNVNSGYNAKKRNKQNESANRSSLRMQGSLSRD
jgi:hypothetical protein